MNNCVNNNINGILLRELALVRCKNLSFTRSLPVIQHRGLLLVVCVTTNERHTYICFLNLNEIRKYPFLLSVFIKAGVMRWELVFQFICLLVLADRIQNIVPNIRWIWCLKTCCRIIFAFCERIPQSLQWIATNRIIGIRFRAGTGEFFSPSPADCLRTLPSILFEYRGSLSGATTIYTSIESKKYINHTLNEKVVIYTAFQTIR